MTKITVKNLGLDFIKHTNRPNSIKENFVRYLLNFGKPFYQVEIFNALSNVNFELFHGDRLGIVGVNGAGKSTLLKVISGIYSPTRGSVDIEGKISSLIEIGAGFDVELTGRENIYLNAMISGYSRAEIKQYEQAIIDFSQLNEFIDTPVKYYSTGMGLRLGFSVATIVNPEILIFDELFAGGDINFIDRAQKRLDQIIDASHIFITVSHQNELIERLCNKILYLKNHTVEYFGTDVAYCLKQYVEDNR